MKFYYNGALVRTSKTHIYKYAIIRKEDLNTTKKKIKPFACSKDMKGIESNLAYLSRDLRIYKAVKHGTYVKIKPYQYSPKEMEKRIIELYGSVEAAIKRAQELFDQWTVVELTAIA